MPRWVREAVEIPRWHRESDVVVVGLGAAGACAALEAVQAGARVLVLERSGAGGGTSALSGGVIYLGGGTAVQRHCGFDDSPEEMFRYLMASCGPRPDRDKIRLYCDESVEHFDWLVHQGVPFKPVFYPHYSGEPPTDDGLVFSGSENAHPFARIARPAPRGHVPRIEGAAGGLLMQKLLAALQRSAAETLTDTRCEALVRDRAGAILGVVTRAHGDQRWVRARRGVVLSTGGFINNREMVSTFAPLLERCNFRVGAEGDDGSGICMGIAVGAAAINMSLGSVSLPIHPPKQLSKGVLVNAQGQRFINEDAYFGRLGEYVLFRNDGRAFLVLDDATFVRPDVPRKVAAVGESVAELEHELDLPHGSLQSTLALYNRHAAKGADPVFHKSREYLTPLDRAPYGALDCTTENSLFAAFTLGGLRTTVDGEVLTADGEIVPGLYAAGRTTSGLSVPGYSSGLSLGEGTFFGRRAGREAARRRASAGPSD